MPTYRILLTQTRMYDFEVEAPTLEAAENLAEARYEADELPGADTDHTIETGCRTCGEALHDDGPDHLPGYCGPCSIPEEQDRARGRSTEGAPAILPQGGDLDALTAEYVAWCAGQGLPEGSAEELLRAAALTDEQAEWLVAFSRRWDAEQERVDAERSAGGAQ